MWKLTNISGANVASFKEFQLSLNQGVTTLVFGHNLDNLDNQPSNGSGKSALIEAISIAITGEPLRKVNVDDIINDNESEMRVDASFSNDETDSTLRVIRVFSRKNPQSVTVIVDGIITPMASVLDANRYILEIIGLTKDEFYHNFILTEQKYESFFASKDRDKKEIINKFSNAQIIDTAIDKLHEDIVEEGARVTNANLVMEKAKSSVEVIESQIEKIKLNIASNSDKREARKKELSGKIALEREEIRTLKRHIEEDNTRFSSYIGIKKAIREYEKPSEGVTIQEYVGAFANFNIRIDADEVKRTIDKLVSSISNFERNICDSRNEVDILQQRIEDEKKILAGMKVKYNLDKESNSEFVKKCETRLLELSDILDSFDDKKRKLDKDIVDAEEAINKSKIKLKGSIVCPKCGNEFFVGSDEDPEDVRDELSKESKKLEAIRGDMNRLKEEHDKSDMEYEELNCQRKKSISMLRDSEFDIDNAVRAIEKLNNKVENLNMAIERNTSNIEDSNYKISKIYENVYDKACEILEDSIRECDAHIKFLKQSLTSHEGKVESYEAEMSELETSKTNNEYLEGLEEELKAKNFELDAATEKYRFVTSKFSDMTTLEKRMVRFKSKLANTKIAALSQSINSILEQLGSDLKVRIDGFQILKNGNVKDKISVAILRNGIEFGSYWKLSKGERCRIDVACIIAMQSIINDNAGDGKGLGLLVLDEIMNGVDELGLVDIYNALNKMKQTCLVVSHNHVSDSYPYKLTVTKSNGISTINN